MFLDGPMEPDHGKRFPCRILIVEDMETSRDLSLAVLRRMGHEADTAEDGADALALPGPHDLVIVDLHLPGEDGIAVARRFLARDPAVHVVLATGDDRPEIRLLAASAGCREVVEKPLTPMKLKRLIEASSGRRPSA